MTEFMFIVLLSCFVLTVTGQSNVTGSHEPVHVTVGHDVILPCHLKPPFNVTTLTVEWRHNKVIVHKYRSRGEEQGKNHTNRTSLFLDELAKGNISLKLTNVTEQDEGNYTCFVPKLDSQVRRGFIKLIVGESDVIGSHEPVHVTVGHDVILPCHLEPPINMTNQTVEWTRNESFVHIYTNKRDYLEEQDKNFRGRTSLFLDELVKGNISLKLTNVTEQDEGNYTCFVPKLDSQVRRGFIKLIVDPEENRNKGNQTDSDKMTEENNNNRHRGFIALGVVLAILVILAIVVIVIWRRRVNHNRHAGQGGGRPRDENELVPMAGNVQPDQHAGQDGGEPQEENELIPRDGNIQPGQDGVEPQEEHVVVPMDDGIEPQEENEEALSADNIQPDPHAGQDGVEPQEENEEVPMDDPHAGQDGVEPQEENEGAAVVGNIQTGRRGKYKPALRTGNIQTDSHVKTETGENLELLRRSESVFISPPSP